MNKLLSELTIEVTQRCPNKCLFCSSLAKKDSENFISLQDVLSLGKQAIELGLSRICISGGEPLCHPDILKIVDGLTYGGLKVSIYTSGLIIDENKKTNPFLNWDLFYQVNPTLIFNVQSTNKIIHDKLVGCNGAFDLTKKSILTAFQKGFKVKINIVPNKLNLSSLESTVIDLIEWGVAQISFLRIVYQGYAKDNINDLYLDMNDMKNLESIFNRLLIYNNEKTRLRFGIPFSGILKKPLKCNAGQNKLIVRYDGNVLPCEGFKDSKDAQFILGDIKHNTLKELLIQGHKLTSLIDLKKKIFHCETCPAQLIGMNI